MAYKIFICYRRDDKEFARSIERRLVEEFGADAVFLDVEDVGPGREWRQRVIEVIDEEPIVVTLITTKWNSRRAGRPKLLDKEDHIRFELKQALKRDLAIVPVLYEPARWPKPDQLPPSLQPILGFQNVPFSYERWDYDAGVLVKALRDILGEPPDPQPEKQPIQVTPRPVSTQPGRPFGQRPTVFSQSMFRESPEAKKAREAALKAETERIERARAEATPFYERWAFWVAALVTLIFGGAALVGAEALARVIANIWTSLPDPPLVAGVVLVLLWAISRIVVSAAAYWYDPDRGAPVFYTRGLFGGYTLTFADYEPVGFWATFPIATVVAWMLARGIAWVPYNFWDWNYALIFWIVLAAYTLPALVVYLGLTYDEIETSYLL